MRILAMMDPVGVVVMLLQSDGEDDGRTAQASCLSCRSIRP
jgi:hypothetical protein